MANTENIEAKLCAYIDGDLDAAGRAEIEKHLAANPQHRGLIEELSKQRELLRALPSETAPEEIIDALQSQMERSVLLGDADTAAEAQTLKIQRWPQLMAVAAIVLLTIGLGAVIYFVLPRHESDAGYAVATQRGGTLDESKLPAPADGAAVPDATAGSGFGGGGAAATGEADSAVAEAGERPAKLMTESAEAPQPATPATPDALAKDKAAEADIFAPAAGKSAGGESALAMNELFDVQTRAQNADLARQLKDAPGGFTDNAMFVVVNTADPSAARSEVTNYLASNKIAWEDVRHPMPQPLDALAGQDVSLSRSQSVNVQMKSGPPQAGQLGVESELQKKAEAKSDSGSAGALAEQQQQQQQQPQPTGTAGQQAAPPSAPAEQRREVSGAVDAKQSIGKASEPVSNAIQPDAALEQANKRREQHPAPAQEQQQQAQQQQQQQLQQSQQQQVAQQPPPAQQLKSQIPARESRLIIARGMTKQQAAELQSNLSKQTTVQRAAVYEQRPLPPAAAAPMLQRSRDRMAATTGPATNPASTAVLKELAAPAPTTVPATQPFTLSDATTRPADAAGQPTTAPFQAGLARDAVAKSADDVVSGATTQPAAIAGDERVDVVILVQDDVTAPSAVMEDPAAQQPNAAPTTAPIAPTTQPAPELTF